MEKIYEINAPEVVDEIFEDEIVVINFENGNYFSLRQSAIDIWQGVREGRSIRSIASLLEAKYEIKAEEAETIVSELVGQLERDGLIRVSSETKQVLSVPRQTEKLVFAAPLYEKFTDMNDLLVLDPMHDVDENGWPHVNPRH